MSFKPARRPHFFYTTAPLPCPYLAGRTERKVVTELTGVSAETLHDRLSRGGFRRSHNIAYAPVCPSCNACIPIRIRARDFAPSRTQKRIARMNADLIVQEMPPRATAEQFHLFQRYQNLRHGDGDMATMSFYDYRAMVEDTPIETSIVEFRAPSGELLGACLTDRLGDGLSAVYSFFSVDMDYALPGHLRHPLADRPRRGTRPAACLSRLLGRGEPKNGLQGQIPPQRNPARRPMDSPGREKC